MIDINYISRDIVTVAKAEDLALLEQQMPTPSIPQMHEQRWVLQEAGKALYLLAWHDGLPVGYALLHFVRPAHHHLSRPAPASAYVEGLTTHPGRLRQGIASSLMHYAESHARRNGAERIGLSVGVENEPAQALYRKLLYQPAGIPPYPLSWSYLDEVTGELKEEGELCEFWIKSLD